MDSSTVFLSSTFVDLQKHRDAVKDALSLQNLRVVGMESFGARQVDATAASLEEVERCGVFVGVYAHRYGFVPDGASTSITEQEFDCARLHNKPVYCFFVAEDHEWKPESIEGGPGRGKLAEFRERVRKSLVCPTFTTPDTLATKVVAAVSMFLQSRRYLPDGDSVTVERITDVTLPEFNTALNLLAKRIPSDERFHMDDITRWIRNGRNRDYFLIARTRARVCGFVLVHCYPEFGLAFIAYMVSAKEVALERGMIAAQLFGGVAELLETDTAVADCRGLLLEVDDPRQAQTEPERRKRAARIELFCGLAASRGYHLQALGMKYCQPLLDLPTADSAGKELPMLLMYASKQIESSLPTDRVEELLKFVYGELYPGDFSPDPNKTEAYRKYLEAYCAERVAELCDPVPLLGSKDFRKQSAAAGSNDSITPAP